MYVCKYPFMPDVNFFLNTRQSKTQFYILKEMSVAYMKVTKNSIGSSMEVF